MQLSTPPAIAHVVYRTRRHAEMVAWYKAVFGAREILANPVLSFLSTDGEHHRFAILDLALIEPQYGDDAGSAHSGVDHIGYTLTSMDDLFRQYERLNEVGIRPYWCVHHGVTVSMYYADPDGNQSEFQVDAFATKEESMAFMTSELMGLNPVGVEFDPDEWLARWKAGEPGSAFLARTVHEPVSPIRGQMSGFA